MQPAAVAHLLPGLGLATPLGCDSGRWVPGFGLRVSGFGFRVAGVRLGAGVGVGVGVSVGVPRCWRGPRRARRGLRQRR